MNNDGLKSNLYCSESIRYTNELLMIYGYTFNINLRKFIELGV